MLLRYEDLHDVVLIGHSYAGAGVTPAVADRVARLAFVDTGPLPDGMTQADFAEPAEQTRTAATVAAAGGGWLLPPPRWAELAAAVPELDPAAVRTLQQRAVPQP